MAKIGKQKGLLVFAPTQPAVEVREHRYRKERQIIGVPQ